MSQKIIIPIFDGAISKNVLRTDIFPLLNEHFEVVLLVPKGKLTYYRKSFEKKAVTVESFVDLNPRNLRNELVWNFVFLNSIYTNSTCIRTRAQFHKDGKLHLFIVKFTLRQLARFSLWKKMLRALYRLFSARVYQHVFENKHVVAVFAPNVTSVHDNLLLLEAQSRGVTTIAMTKSWDHLTSKGFIPVIPDRLLVQTEEMKREAISIACVPETRIVVVGTPQFDVYESRETYVDKQAFLASVGYTVRVPKHIILYCSVGHLFSPYDQVIVGRLAEWIESGIVSQDTVILARLHPKYAHSEESFSKSDYAHVYRPGIIVEPGKVASWEFEKPDIAILANSLKHSSVVICTGSTMSVEASLFNRPTICIGFDGRTKYFESVRRFYDFEHYKPIVSSGAARLVNDFDELQKQLNAYLVDPSFDSGARVQLKKENLAGHVGTSGTYIAHQIIQAISDLHG